MAGQVKVQLTARDDASGVFNKFKTNANTALAAVGQASQRQVKTATTGFANLAKSAVKVSAALAGIGLASTALTKLGKGIGNAVGTVTDFETAIAKLATLGGDVAANIGSIRTRLLQMNPALGDSSKLAGALFEALTKGANVPQAFDQLLVAAEAAVGQIGDVNEIISLTNQIMQAFGDRALSARQQMDEFVAVTQTGNITFQQLPKAMGTVLGQVAQLGGTATDAANAIAQIAIVTGDVNKAVTGFRNILNQMIKRQQEFKDAGIDILKVYSEQGFIGAMRAVQGVVQNTDTSLSDFFTNIRAFNAAGIATGPVLDNMERALNRVKQASGETQTNFQVMTQTLKQGLVNVGNAFRTALIKIAGDDFGTLRGILQKVENLFVSIGNHAPQIQAGFIALKGTVIALAEGFVSVTAAGLQFVGFVTEGFANVLSTITPVLREVGAWMAQFGVGVTRTMGNALLDLSTKLPAAAVHLRNFGGDVNQSGMDIERYASVLRGLGVKAVGEMGDKWNETGIQTKIWSDKVDDSTTATKKSSTELDKLAQAANDFGKQTQEATGEVEDFVGAHTEIKKVNGQWVIIAKGVGEAAKAIGEATEEVASAQEKMTESTNKSATAMAEVTVEGENYSGALEDVVQQLREAKKETGSLEGATLTLTGTVKKAATGAKDAGEAFKEAFGKASSTLTQMGKNAIERFAAIRAAGLASPKAIADGFRKEFERIREIFGPNHPVTKDMRAFLDTLEREAGQTTSRLKDMFEDLGVSITLPTKDVGEKYKQSFQEIINSGEFTREQLHKIFVDQIRPKLLDTPKGVPQAWEANFGPASDSAKRLADRVESNMARIGESGRKAGQDLADGLEAGFERAGSIAARFSDKMDSDLQRLARGQSKLTDFGSRGTTDRTRDFGQGQDSQFNRDFGSGDIINALGSGDRDKILLEIEKLDQQAAETRGNAWIERRRQLIAELRAMDQAAIDQRKAAQDQINQQRQEFINAGRGPQRAGTPNFDNTRMEMLQAEERQLQTLKFRQQQITAPLGELLRLQREGLEVDTSRNEALRRNAEMAKQRLESAKAEFDIAVSQGASEDRLLVLRQQIAKASVDFQSANRAALAVVEASIPIHEQIASIRAREWEIVKQIDAIEARREERNRNFAPNVAIAPPSRSFVPDAGLLQAAGLGGGSNNQIAGLNNAIKDNTNSNQQLSQSQRDLIDQGFTRTGNNLVDQQRATGGGFGSQIGSRNTAPTLQLIHQGTNTGISLGTGEGFGINQFGGAGFANGGIVPQDGIFRLEAGELVVPRGAQVRDDSTVSSGGRNDEAERLPVIPSSPDVTFTGRGVTDIITQGGESTSSSLFNLSAGQRAANARSGFTPSTGPQAGGIMFGRLAAQGRMQDVLGHQGQRQIAKALVPATRQAIRRRDITADITRNTPLTQQGAATVK